MASAPSLSEVAATSFRVSLVRTGEGPDAAWLAEVDEFPDCAGRGATPEEAVRRMWAAAARSAQDEEEKPRHSGKLLVRMPATLHDELARAAEREGVSLNQLITGILAGSVEWRSGDADAGTDSESPRWLSGGAASGLLIANLVIVALAAIVAIAVLVAAWQ
jgi:predicted RNase H-like HicB family nuclease